MAIPDKKLQSHTFEAGLNSDDAPEIMPSNQARYILNCTSYSYGNTGVLTNVLGNTLVSTSLPSGNNTTIGYVPNEATNKFYFFVYNDQGYHTIFMYDGNSKNISRVLQSRTDSNDQDILRFDKDFLVLHADVVDDKLLYWVDGLNKARKFNINKAIDKSATGYGLIIPEDYITAYKKTSVYAPAVSYFTDVTRNSNNLYGNLFKFTQWFIYDDGELSNPSDWTAVPLPANQSYLGVNAITFDNNAIQVQGESGSPLVKKIVIAVQVNSVNNTAGTIQTTNFVICTVLDKEQLNIADNSNYVYNFYNDGSYASTDQAKIIRNFIYLPRVPKCQSFVRMAMTYANFNEGFPNVIINATVKCNLIDLFLPDNTQNQLNNPELLVTQTSTQGQEHIIIFSAGRVNSFHHFVVGFDVKKGNKFEVFGQNGSNDNYYFSYTATGADTSITVSNQIKAFLRGLGRAINGVDITNEHVDGSGNVSWDFAYLGQWHKNATRFTGHVNPVNYQTLKDNGDSVQVIKYGGVRNYGIVYIDDDGRESNAYTSDLLVVRTPFITEIGSLKRPVHELTINHQPPLWAKYWKLVRTPDVPNFIEMLIQKVINYTTESADAYLDLVVGSLATYNVVHPNSILKYEFVAGDRLRLVKYYDETTSAATYYAPYETEVLSYLTDVEETKNENVVLNGSDTVTIAGTTDASFVGKNISVNGYERTIIGVPSGNQYKLDKPYVTTETYPNYKLIDRRGVIRIKKPVGVTISNLSLVEIYRPQAQSVSADYRNFFDFQMKFEIANWGTANAYHRGTVQDQTASQPAIIQTQNGDSYIRAREMPTNNIFPGTQFLVDNINDPNYSDFYISDLHDLGRVYPQDTGLGEVHFGSRVRYSNNYIQDTSVNGLGDFDNSSRKDYNDPYGDIMRTRYRKDRLYVFKFLRDAYVPVYHTLTTGTDNNSLLVSTEQLLNEIRYFEWKGGIGNNPESLSDNDNYMYHVSANSGVFIRIDGEGVEPISQQRKFDFATKQLLNNIQKYNLKIFGGFNRIDNEQIWTTPPFVPYVYNGTFNANDWSTTGDYLGTGVTYAILQQPANGTVAYNSTTGLLEVNMNSEFVGSDFAIYQATLSNGTVLPVKKLCITSVEPANRVTAWVAKTGTEYCIVKEVITIDYEVVEAADFADANLTIEVNGVDVKTVNNTETGSVEVSVGDSVRFIATGELSATGFNPTIRMYYDKSGVQQYDSGEIADNPPPTVAFATPLFTILSGADYYVNVTSKVATVNPFAFTPQIEVSPSTPIPSNTITVGGSGGPVPISVVNGMYSINSGPYTAAAGSVNIGDIVSVQVMSSSAYKTAASATLTIADQSATFTVTTFHVFTLNFHNQDQSVPYSDSNIAASNGGTTIDRITGSGDFYGYIRQARLPLAFEVFSENPSTGTDATKTMRITRTVGGVTTTIYGPTTNSNNPGDPSLTYVENGVDDATYDAYGSAAADGSATTFGLVNVTGYVVPYTVYSDGSGTTVISSGNIANNSSLDIDALLTGTQTIKLFAPQSGAYNEYYLPGGSLSGTVNNAAGTSFFSTNRAGISSYVASGYSGLRFTYTPISITYRSSNSYVVAGTLSYQIVEDSTGTVVGSGVVGAGNPSPNTAVLTSNSGTLTVTFVANGSYSPAGTKVRILNDNNSTEIAGPQSFNPGDTKVFSLIPKVNLVFQTTS